MAADDAIGAVAADFCRQISTEMRRRQHPGQRQSISAASAVNANGAFWFCTYEGGLNAELFVVLLKQI